MLVRRSVQPAPPAPNEAARLTALRDTDILDTAEEDAFDELARMAAEACQAPIALVSLVDEHRQWFKACVGLAGRETPRDRAFCAHAILQGSLFEVPDATQDVRFRANPLVTGEPGLRFYAGAPITSDDGLPLGTLCVLDRVPRRLEFAQQRILTMLARQASTLLQLRRANRRLTRALAVRDTILSDAEQAILSTDAHGVIQTFNPAAERLLGHHAADVIGRCTLAAFHDPAELAARTSAGDGTAPGGFLALADMAARRGGDAREWTWRRRDGSPLCVQLSVTCLRDGQDRIIGYVAMAVDGSARGGLDRLKDAFISTVSHELRTPMTSVHGALRLLEGGVVGTLPVAAQELVRMASTNTGRLVRLINDVVDLEKLAAGQLDLEVSDVDPATIIAGVVREIAGAEPAAPVHMDVHGAVPPVRADADRLAQVLTNLVGNALKFSPAGRPVHVGAAQVTSGCVRFSVSDQGPGIPPRDVARLFQRFQPLDGSDTRRQGGAGLGLFICKSIVEQHGGTIGVHSTPGEGATFWLELPIASAG